MEYKLYRFNRPIIKVLMKFLFRVEIIGSENIIYISKNYRYRKYFLYIIALNIYSAKFYLFHFYEIAFVFSIFS